MDKIIESVQTISVKDFKPEDILEKTIKIVVRNQVIDSNLNHVEAINAVTFTDDSVLEFNVIEIAGRHVVIAKYLDPEAARGWFWSRRS